MKRRTALALVWTAPSVVFLLIAAVVYAKYRVAHPPRLDDNARTQIMATLRASVEGTTPVPCTVQGSGEHPVIVTLWSEGKPFARVEGTGGTLAEAIDHAALELRTKAQTLAADKRGEARLQVDVIVGTAPLEGVGAIAMPGVQEMLAINPGVDGLGAYVSDKRSLLAPHELVRAKVLNKTRPSKQMPDFAMGIDLAKIRTLLAQNVGEKVMPTDVELFRFQTDAFVEAPLAQRPRAPYQLYRGNTEAPKISAAELRKQALSGGRYLVAHLAPTGRYIYEHDLATGKMSDPRGGPYSMPRHAGTTYFLAELYRITKEEWLREPIERAFKHLAELMSNGRCTHTLEDGTPIDCVIDRSERNAQLGSTALTVVALAEYQRATGDTRYLETATRLTNFILWMQREDGSFRHLYDPKNKKRDDVTELFYYSGESALALARMHLITGDKKYAVAAEKALDWLVAWYDFFVGGFIYGEEHWTCIASEAAFPAAKNPAYKDFCHGYGRFLRAQQPEKGDHPDQDDFAGAYNVTSFVPPYNTPAGSRTEAMISAYLLGRHHGTPDADVRAQIVAALQYTLGQIIRPENDFSAAGPNVLGGMPATPIDRNVRIDFVQHVCSAMIRASEWLEDGKP